MFLLNFFKKNKTINAKKFKKIIGEGVSVYTYRKIDSTNSEAARKLHKNITLPALFVTRSQTAGRGRRGRSFFSKGGLYMTLALNPETENTVSLTTLVSVAVARAIDEVCGVKVGIKWVNDIYFEGRKICGILCENVCDPISGESRGVIIGIGVNLGVNDFPNEIKNIAGGLSDSTVSAEKLCAKITENIFVCINNPETTLRKYKALSIVLGKEITYEQNGITQTAKALDIDPFGGLVVKNQNEEMVTLSSGEITIRF
jgi:BirA family biotin operon repressor/biotin-[acetyl-CoA-carboxylase] ligase